MVGVHLCRLDGNSRVGRDMLIWFFPHFLCARGCQGVEYRRLGVVNGIFVSLTACRRLDYGLAVFAEECLDNPANRWGTGTLDRIPRDVAQMAEERP